MNKCSQCIFSYDFNNKVSDEVFYFYCGIIRKPILCEIIHDSDKKNITSDSIACDKFFDRFIAHNQLEKFHGN